jgi:hypothetical protein
MAGTDGAPLVFHPAVSRRTRRRIHRANALLDASAGRTRPGRAAGISAAATVIMMMAGTVIRFDPPSPDGFPDSVLPSLASALWPFAVTVATAALVLSFLASGSAAIRLALARLVLHRNAATYLDVSAAISQSRAVAQRLDRLGHTLHRLRGNTAIAEGWVPGVSDPTFDELEWTLTGSLTTTIASRKAIADAAGRATLAALAAQQSAKIAAEDAAVDEALDQLATLADTADAIQQQLRDLDLASRLGASNAETVAGPPINLAAPDTDLASLAASAGGVRELLDAQLRRLP